MFGVHPRTKAELPSLTPRAVQPVKSPGSWRDDFIERGARGGGRKLLGGVIFGTLEAPKSIVGSLKSGS